jgi:hypothetical protein
VDGQHHVHAVLPRERPGTHCTGGWVGRKAGLEVCEKSRPHRDSIPGKSNTYTPITFNVTISQSVALHRLTNPPPPPNNFLQ